MIRLNKIVLSVMMVSAIFISCNTQLLEAPVLASVTEGEVGMVVVSWNRNYDADGYVVYRSTEEGGEYLPLTEELIDDNRYVDRDAVLADGTVFWYKVVAVKLGAGGVELSRSELSLAASGNSTPINSSLASVGSLAAEGIGWYAEGDPIEPEPARFKGVRMSWSPVEGADYYRVMKETAPDVYTLINQLNEENIVPLLLTDPEYVDYYPVSGEVNRYKIVPFSFGPNGSADAAGAASGTVEVSLPALPATSSWSTQVPDTISLGWDAVDGAVSYRVSRDDGTTIEARAAATNSLSDPGRDITIPYNYAIEALVELVVVVANVAQPAVPFYFDCEKSMTASFFAALTLEVSQGEGPEIALKWPNAKEPGITEYSIYRQKVQTTWTADASRNVTFPETYYGVTQKSDLDLASSETFVDTANNTVNQVLKMGIVSAFDAGGVDRLNNISFVDNRTGNEKTVPGLYRYYVVGGDGVISATGYRTITDREFVQEVSRQLDLVMVNDRTNSKQTANGGTYSYSSGSNTYRYNLVDLEVNGLLMTTDGFHDTSWYGGLKVRWFGRRVGTITVSGLYSGSIRVRLARDHSTLDRSGGALKPVWNNAFNVLDGDDNYNPSTSADKLHNGLIWLSRSGVDTTIRWDEGAWDEGAGETRATYYSSGNFNSRSDIQAVKVEPNYNSDYVEWSVQ